jgi:hypothetical protein
MRPFTALGSKIRFAILREGRAEKEASGIDRPPTRIPPSIDSFIHDGVE